MNAANLIVQGSSSLSNLRSPLKTENKNVPIKSSEKEMIPRKGRKPYSNVYKDDKDYQALKGPCDPGETYGVSMKAVTQLSDDISK